MTLPLSTTTITVKRGPQDGTVDPYDTQPSPSTVASGVRAVINAPSGSGSEIGGQEEAAMFRLSCDPVDLRHTDTVIDDAGVVYRVVWAVARTGLGLDHMQAGLRRVQGQVA